MAEIKEKMQQNAFPVNLDDANKTEENLIDFKEFHGALKSAKKGLFYKILPRTLSFLAVLESVPVEPSLEISDLHLDDFHFFRYELQTINKKHLFLEEQKNDAQMFGKHPLSYYEGASPVKDLMRELKNRDQNNKEVIEMRKKCSDIYSPPGIVKVHETPFKKQQNLDEDIRGGIPKDNIFRRNKVAQHISGGMKHFR